MPLYEYECEKCKTRFTVFQSMGEGKENLACPKCESKEIKKSFSSFSSCFSSESCDGSFGFG